MKKVIIIAITILALVTSIFAFEVSEVNNSINVIGRFVEYYISVYGYLEDVFLNQMGKKTHIYTYTNDGFDLVGHSTPSSYSVENSNGNVIVRFSYPDGIIKEYEFVDGPYYEFYVRLNKTTSITLPSVYDVVYDYSKTPFYVSYYPKTKALAVLKVDGKLNGNIAECKEIHVYMGPPKKTLLLGAFKEDYDKIVEILNEMRVYGWYDAIFYPLVWFFYWLYELTGNFGWAIIIFTFVVRLVLYPLYHAQTKSLIKMRKIQKDIERIRKKYKDPRRQQEELMKLYREKGVNPMSGCLIMLVQLPIFFMLWGVIRFFEEEFAYGKPFLIWKDLSVGGFQANGLLVLITIIATFYSTLITSQDTKTAWQGILISVIFPLLFISLPSGLFLYYATNTIIQLVVTYYIYKRYNIKGITVRELLGMPKKAK